mgnify:CR=1 FL=1
MLVTKAWYRAATAKHTIALSPRGARYSPCVSTYCCGGKEQTKREVDVTHTQACKVDTDCIATLPAQHLHYGKRGPIRWAKLGLQSVMARSQIGLIRAGLAVDSAECKPIRSWLGLLFGGQGRP